MAGQDEALSARPAHPTDDHRQRCARHLLARPRGIGPDRVEVRPHDLDGQVQVVEGTGRPVRDDLLRTGDARDPDERP